VKSEERNGRDGGKSVLYCFIRYYKRKI